MSLFQFEEHALKKLKIVSTLIANQTIQIRKNTYGPELKT